MNTFRANNERSSLPMSGEFRSIWFCFTAEALEWLSGTTTIKSIFGRNALPSVSQKDEVGQPLTTNDSTSSGRHRKTARMH